MQEYFDELKTIITNDANSSDLSDSSEFDEDDEPIVSPDPDNFNSAFITEEETNNESQSIISAFENEEDENEQTDAMSIAESAQYIDQSREEEEVFETTFVDAPEMEGGSRKHSVHIIYSFLPRLITKLTSSGVDVYNLAPHLNRIVKRVHADLPNAFITPKKLLTKLIIAIDATIMQLANKHDVLFFPVVPKLASFDVYYFFNYLTRKDNMHHYTMTIANVDTPLMMSRLHEDFNNSPYRMSLIRSCAAISKHYAQATTSQKSNIEVTKEDIANELSQFKSMFSDKQEQKTFINSMINIIFPRDSNDSITMTQQIIGLPYKNTCVANILSTDSDAEIARKLLPTTMIPAAR